MGRSARIITFGTLGLILTLTFSLLGAETDPLKRGKRLETEKQFEKALAAYQEAVRKNPHAAEAQFRLGDLYRKLGRYNDSIRPLERAAQDKKFPEASAALGASYAGLGQWPKAVEQFTKALDRDPKLWAVYESLADAYLANKEPEKAITVLQKASSGPAENVFPQYKLGLVLMSLDRFDPAVAQFDQVLRAVPEFYMAHFHKGKIFGRQGQDEAAEQEFQKAIAINPNLDIAYFELAALNDRMQKTEEAIHLYQKTLQMNPYTGNVRVRLAELYYRMGRYDDSIPLYEAALEYESEAFMIYFRLGEIYQKKKMPELAIAHYQKALDAFPILYSARYNLGLVLMEQERYSEATKELTEVMRLNPNFSAVHYQLGVISNRVGRRDEARRHFEEYLRQEPEGDFSSDSRKSLAADSGSGAVPIKIVKTSPAYAEEVRDFKNRVIVIQFSREMDPTLQEDFVLDQRGVTDEHGDPVEIKGEFSWPDPKTLEFRPGEQLKPNATYQISLFSVRTKEGEEMDTVPFRSVFTTGSGK